MEISNPDLTTENNLLRRLERSLDAQEREYQKTRDDVNSLKNQQNVIQRDIAAMTITVQALMAKMDERTKPNWTAIALAVTMFIAVVPGMGFVMTTYVSSALGPVASAASINAADLKHATDSLNVVENQAIASQSSDANSQVDRAQLNSRVRQLETQVNTEVGDRRSLAAITKVSLAEIESEFHAMSNLENLRVAQQDRLNAMLWEKSHPGERFPSTTFFPTTIFKDTRNDPNNLGAPQ